MKAAISASLAALPPGLIWRGGALARPALSGWSTGFTALDAELPGGGWPRGAIIELLSEHAGIGELELVLPLLRNTPAQRWVVWVAPPCLPYAPALAAAGVPLTQLLVVDAADRAKTVWAARQAIASGACHAVLAWADRIETAALRRLQLASEASQTPLFLYRPASAAVQPSPASLRLRLVPDDGFLDILILKRRGPAATAALRLPLRAGSESKPCHAVDSPHPARSASAGVHARRG